VKLLLDENLSPRVAERLRGDGVDACHLRDRGLLGVPDEEVLERAFLEDRILVTSNVNDFLRLARARELHAGIVLVEQGDLLRDDQLVLLRQVVPAIEAHGDMVNLLLRVAASGGMTFEEVPAGTTE
jgi:predicted nuclease of predicted toxin-antitoxin system